KYIGVRWADVHDFGVRAYIVPQLKAAIHKRHGGRGGKQRGTSGNVQNVVLSRHAEVNQAEAGAARHFKLAETSQIPFVAMVSGRGDAQGLVGQACGGIKKIHHGRAVRAKGVVKHNPRRSGNTAPVEELNPGACVQGDRKQQSNRASRPVKLFHMTTFLNNVSLRSADRLRERARSCAVRTFWPRL